MYDYLIYFILLSVSLYLYICVVALFYECIYCTQYQLQLQILVKLNRDAEYNCTSLLVFIIYSQSKVFLLLLFFTSLS